MDLDTAVIAFNICVLDPLILIYIILKRVKGGGGN
jgi:hypothetical protein